MSPLEAHLRSSPHVPSMAHPRPPGAIASWTPPSAGHNLNREEERVKATNLRLCLVSGIIKERRDEGLAGSHPQIRHALSGIKAPPPPSW